MKLLLSSLLILIFSGCSCKENIIEKPVEVKVPVKCVVPEIEKPKPGKNMSETMINIKEYVLKLEAALESCR